MSEIKAVKIFNKIFYKCSNCGRMPIHSKTGLCNRCDKIKKFSNKTCSACGTPIGRNSQHGLCRDCLRNRNETRFMAPKDEDFDFKRFLIGQLKAMYDAMLERLQQQYDSEINPTPLCSGNNKEKIRMIQRDIEKLKQARDEIKKAIENYRIEK